MRKFCNLDLLNLRIWIYFTKCVDSVTAIVVMGCDSYWGTEWMERACKSILCRDKKFSFLRRSRPTLMPTKFPVQWLPWDFYFRGQREVGHSRTWNVRVRCDCNYTPSTVWAFMVMCWSQRGHKFTVLKSLSVLVPVASRQSSLDDISHNECKSVRQPFISFSSCHILLQCVCFFVGLTTALPRGMRAFCVIRLPCSEQR
jgi:hypothetical protein